MDYPVHIAAQRHPVLDFAAEELRKYMQAVTGVKLEQGLGGFSLRVNPALDDGLDAYTVTCCPPEVEICGATPRAVLFGVYGFCREVLGVGFILPPEREIVPHIPPEKLPFRSFSDKGRFRIRAYTPDMPLDCAQPIDRLAKWGYNTYALSARLWEENKAVMGPELRKRGMGVCLCGHDIGFLVPASRYFASHPQWFALREGERVPAQMCYSHPGFLAELAKNLTAYCRRNPDIRSAELMFNDNAQLCGCERCRGRNFVDIYWEGVRMVREQLRGEGVELEISAIAYNAALEWTMLENLPQRETGGCMLACWGRNYAHSLNAPEDGFQNRFRLAFENWSRRQRENGAPFAIFEYYGDHWMMGSLLPPLPQRIPEDLDLFHSRGADAIVALHFPYRSAIQVMREVVGEEDADEEEYATEDWAAWLNLYLTGRNMWESAASENPLDDYLRAGFGASADAARELLMQAEEALAPLTRFSTALFKLRICDPWFRDDFSMRETGKTRVHPWDPEEDNAALTREAAAACRRAAQQMVKALEAAARMQKPQTAKEMWREFLGCYQYLGDKTASLAYQYEAQERLLDGDRAAAAGCLRKALELEEAFDGLEIRHCQEWLLRLEND